MSDWFLLQCKPNQQARAQAHLDNQGFTTYAPRLKKPSGLSAANASSATKPCSPVTCLFNWPRTATGAHYTPPAVSAAWSALTMHHTK